MSTTKSIPVFRPKKNGVIDLAANDSIWSGRRDLNSRPHAPEACALTGLRYAPPLKIP